MPRTSVPLHAADISSFARSLERDLVAAFARTAQLPGHVQLLNMLARAAGYRNFQSLKARPPAPAPAAPASVIEPLSDRAAKALRQFDEHGRLTRWPIKFSVQRLMLWGLWIRFDARRRYTERQVNELLNAWHLFGDHCTLRRELITEKLLDRRSDGSQYWKLPARPDAPTMVFLKALRARAGGG